MINREVSLVKSFILFGAIVICSVVGIVFYQKNTAQPAQATSGAALADVHPANFASVIEKIEIHSSNADKKLILRITPKSDGMTQYSYIVADISGANERLLFDKTLPAGSSMALPANSWDPTDTYVFIGEKAGGVPNYYVMKSTGGFLIDVGAVWKEKKIPYTIRTATGWASGTLLIIYTSKDDGSRGPAYWFEIPSTAILQLAS